VKKNPIDFTAESCDAMVSTYELGPNLSPLVLGKSPSEGPIQF
jgi:hypothetical protein